MCFSETGDSLLTLKRALEAKELARQQLREQLDEVERETRSKLQEIDVFNNQLKVILGAVWHPLYGREDSLHRHHSGLLYE